MALKKHHELAPELESLAQTVIGAAIEVHRQLGPGFLESVYEKALSIELSGRDIHHACQHPTQVKYRDTIVGEGRIDILVDRRLVLELNAPTSSNRFTKPRSSLISKQPICPWACSSTSVSPDSSMASNA